MSITKLITEIEAFTKGSLIEPATHNADSERLLAAALSLVSALQPTEDEAWRLVMAVRYALSASIGVDLAHATVAHYICRIEGRHTHGSL